MPCYTDPPKISHHEWLERMLCQAMRMLTVDQMRSMKSIDIYITAHHWYADHLHSDFIEAWEAKDQEAMDRYSKEIERIGGKISFEKDGVRRGRPYLEYYG